MASNKQKLIFENDEFVNSYVERLVKEKPVWDNDFDNRNLFQLFKAGAQSNMKDKPASFTIGHGACSATWTKLREKAGLEARPGVSYREYLCNILGEDNTAVEARYRRLTEKKPKEPYPHETAERPTAKQVAALVETGAPTEVDLKQALWDMMTMLTEDDWKIIDFYRESVL